MNKIPMYLKFAIVFVLLLSPNNFISACYVDESIVINDEDADKINTGTNYSSVQKSARIGTSTNQLDYSYLIPDLEFRKHINTSLGKTGSEIETYQATIADLESLNTLLLSELPGEMTIYESLEGIQYMTNLTSLRFLRVSIPESSLELIGQLPSAERITFNDMIFGGDDGTLRRFNVSVNDGPVQEEAYIPFDQFIDLSPLGNITSLIYFDFTINGVQYDSQYSHSNRTHFDVSGLGSLTNLEQLYLNNMGSVDDPSFSFLESLTNLTTLNLSYTPLNDVSAIAALENLYNFRITGTYVTDFTPIINEAYFTGASSLKINFPISYYDTKEINGEMVDILSVDTGITLGSDLDTIGFTTITSHLGSFGINSHVYNGTLMIDFNLNYFNTFNLLNWETGLYDLPYIGFVWGANITTTNGKSINYSLNTMNIGKKVVFDENYEGGSTTEVLYDPFKLIEEPTSGNLVVPTREGYVLVGWSTDPDGNELFDFTTAQDRNITLYAVWNPVDPTDEELPPGGLSNSIHYIMFVILGIVCFRLVLSKRLKG